MNIITPEFEIIEQQYNKATLCEDMLKHIEVCGRNCYKSEDKITDTSYEKFVERLVKSEHGAMLEHGTVYLTIPLGTPAYEPDYIWKMDIIRFFQNNPYSKVNSKFYNEDINVKINGYDMNRYASATFYYITTNWRVIIENKDFEVVQYMGGMKSITGTLKDSVLQWMTEPSEEHEKRYTVKFTCDIGVTREFNRHRKDSIAEESTRYCNYAKDKFGSELNICKPEWIDKDWLSEGEYASIGYDIFKYCYAIYQQKDKDEFSTIDYWLFSNLAAEYSYMNLIRLGWPAQQARIVLPLDTKSTLIHTAFASDWVHFFELRALGKTGAPHPSAKELAEPLMKEFISRKYIDEIK